MAKQKSRARTERIGAHARSQSDSNTRSLQQRDRRLASTDACAWHNENALHPGWRRDVAMPRGGTSGRVSWEE